MKPEDIYETLDQAYFSAEPHEKEMLDRLPRILPPCRVFVDVGASLDQYAFHANQCLHDSLIIAIEADPIRFDRLQSNCRKWAALSDNEIRAVQAAASDVDGQTEFFVTNSNVSGGLFKHDLSDLPVRVQESVQWQSISVRCCRLDTLLKDTSPDFVKTDVEGGELRVLKGCTRTLEEGKTRFLIEFHAWEDPQGPRDVGDVFALMKSYGYSPTDLYGKQLFTRKGRASMFLLSCARSIKWSSRSMVRQRQD